MVGATVGTTIIVGTDVLGVDVVGTGVGIDDGIGVGTDVFGGGV